MKFYMKFKKTALVIILLLVAAIIFSFIVPRSLFCNHNNYVDGICENCSEQCVHSFNNEGKCSICNKECVHTWEHGMCVTCNIYCKHLSYINGQCDVCKYNCPHNGYENGICVTCQCECPHENHTQEKGVCLVCQTPVFHDYVNGECVICNRTPVFYTDYLPEEYYLENNEQGNIETISYTCKNYSVKDAYIDRQMMIWTPYGYNENTRYNVLILMHGGGGIYRDWMTSTFEFGKYAIRLNNIYDRIVEENNVAPFMVVSISAHSDDEQIAGELRDTIIPYVVENYSTWAESSNIEDVVKARDHFGIGGLSNGSRHTFNAGMSMNFDIFGNYMTLSGNGQEKNVEKAIRSEEYKDLSVRCFFSGCGTNDSLILQTSVGYEYILECSDGRLVSEANAWYQDVAGGHDWKVWSTEIVNALQVMF